MASLKTLSEKTPAKSLINKLKTLSAKSTENIIIGEEISTTNSGTSYFTNFIRYGIVIIILAFLGLNIFASLGYLTIDLINFFKPILLFIGHPISETVKQTVDTSKEGTKAIINATKKVIDEANDSVIESDPNSNPNSNPKNNKLQQRMNVEKLATMRSLNDAQFKQNSKGPEPDEAGSRTQSSQSSSKTGYCYIGEDRGFRSCIKVGENDECISGDIFPTREICINPNLRL
jgi:hypothetical protein